MLEFIVHQWWLVALVIGSLVPLVMRVASGGLLQTARTLDRRWIFLLMLWAVLIPIYFIGVTGRTFPEVPSALARATFQEIDRLMPGDPVLLAFDYDPASEGELGPMATAFVKHAAEKKLRMYFLALWPLGSQMIDTTIARVITADYPSLAYGSDYVNLGYKSGNEGVIKVIVTNLRELYTTDSRGTALQDIPMMRDINNIQQMKLIVNVSAGYPGTKEWVQYAVTPFPAIRLVAGATGVQAPLLYPYIPRQLPGLLGAIKGAAEYEKLVIDTYGGPTPNPKYLEALRRMGPQLVGHLLIIALIVMANVVYFVDRSRGASMTRGSMIAIGLMLAGLLALGARAATGNMGREYVRAVPVANGQWTQETPATRADYLRAEAAQPGQTEYHFSLPRTVGLWIAAFFTLAIFSFLYGDNPFYKVAEAVLVGVSAAYWMVVAFWDVLVPNLIGKISPATVQAWAMPGLIGPEAERSLSYLVALVLGGMLLMRLSPKGSWIARWPLAFVIGTTAGLRLIGFLHGDFLVQIRNSILPLAVITNGAWDPWASLQNLLIVVGVLCTLVYFFFSVEHKGIVGATAKTGIWVLMITFGAAFGYTVMGRIALLAIRLEFLMDDWLWLIDPIGKRTL